MVDLFLKYDFSLSNSPRMVVKMVFPITNLLLVTFVNFIIIITTKDLAEIHDHLAIDEDGSKVENSLFIMIILSSLDSEFWLRPVGVLC